MGGDIEFPQDLLGGADFVSLASRRLGLAAGTRVVRLRMSRRVRRVIGRTPRRFRVQLVLTATDAAGNRTVVRRTIRVRR